jgi:hypothetical protein
MGLLSPPSRRRKRPLEVGERGTARLAGRLGATDCGKATAWDLTWLARIWAAHAEGGEVESGAKPVIAGDPTDDAGGDSRLLTAVMLERSAVDVAETGIVVDVEIEDDGVEVARAGIVSARLHDYEYNPVWGFLTDQVQLR